MNETTLREALQTLPTPDLPADLHARCRATIPPPRRPRWGRGLALAACAVAIALGLVLLPRGKTPASGVAWADVQRVMDTVTVWHARGRSRGWSSSQIRFDDSWWSNPNCWHPTETWMDFERGYRMKYAITNGEMTRPNGDVFIRHDDRVAVTYFGGQYWPKGRVSMRRTMQWIAAGKDASAASVLRRDRIVWKERPALRFETVETPEARRGDELSQHGILRRSETLVDPESRRILAAREYLIWTRESGRPERLVSESEFDYPERIDPAVFDPRKFCAGAAWIHTQKGGDGVIVSPP